MTAGAQAALLEDGARLHLQHGPIDLIIGADPVTPGTRRLAFQAATDRFATILTELTDELPLLRAAVTAHSPRPSGVVAQRMHDAVLAHAGPVFVTPMAAVAGSVADEVLAAMTAATPLARAYVNNGGDIALHLAPDQAFTAAISGLDGSDLGQVRLPACAGIGGIATSGQGGRSHSFGIADSVTVLATTAAAADVAATLITNAVDLPDHPAIHRTPASDLSPDSDLGARPVVIHVGPLTHNDTSQALDRGMAIAYAMKTGGQIIGAYLTLRGQTRLIGRIPLQPALQRTPHIGDDLQPKVAHA